MAGRHHIIQIRLTDDEFDVMESRKGSLGPGGFFRELLHKEMGRSNGQPVERPSGVPTYEELLWILFRMAKDGRVAAAIHLAKVLGEEDRPDEAHGWFDELTAKRDKNGGHRSYDRQSDGR